MKTKPDTTKTNVNAIYGAHQVVVTGILQHRTYSQPEYFVKTCDLAEHQREIEFVWKDEGRIDPLARGIGDLVQVTGVIAWVYINTPYDKNITVRLEHVRITLVGAYINDDASDE